MGGKRAFTVFPDPGIQSKIEKIMEQIENGIHRGLCVIGHVSANIRSMHAIVDLCFQIALAHAAHAVPAECSPIPIVWIVRIL